MSGLSREVTPAPMLLVDAVQTCAFHVILDSLMSSTADDFKKTDEFKQLKLKEKLEKPACPLQLFIVEDKTSPCHIRFVSFVEGHKDKSLKTKFTCVILLNRVLHKKKI
jgi:hypothetical protein